MIGSIKPVDPDNGKSSFQSTTEQGSVRRALALLLFILGFPLGALTLVGSILAAASLFDAPGILYSVGFVSSFLVLFALSYLSLMCYGFVRRRRISFAISGVATPVLLIAFALFFLKPLVPEGQQFVREIPDDIELWSLHTGSVVAVRKSAASSSPVRRPVLFLHGGPGAYSVALRSTVEVHSRLSADGHDVYFYDQVGGGLSARLPDISRYTFDRHLDDLEAVYERIGSEKIILIGSSGGASLGASYMARHPTHVAAAVFSGPGPLYHPAWSDIGDGGLDEQLSPEQSVAFADMVETPRLFAALVLADINPRAAVRFAGEYEMGSLFDKVANEFYVPIALCNRQGVDVVSRGYGFWSNRMTTKSLLSRQYDPRPVLRQNTTPILILRGACEYKKEQVAAEYANVFQNSRFRTFDDAGHMVFWEQPDAYLLHVREFLSEVVPFSPATSR